MNKIRFFISFIVIVILHFLALTFLYEKEVPKTVSKPKYQKVSVRFAQQKIPTPVEKIVEKKIEKPLVEEKKIFKKPIKKEAKRKLVKKIIKKQKPKKKIVKKIIKKPLKKPIKKVVKVVKKEPAKKLEKVVKETISKKAVTTKQVARKAATQSLEKFKKFKEDYLTALRAAIDKNKKYPVASKRLEEKGLVKVSFRVLKSGAFENIKLISSSGKKRLDRAALKALRVTGSFKPFTKDIKKEYMDLTVPIEFKL